MHSTRLLPCAAAWLVLFVCSPVAEAVEFHFTVTTDMRDKHSAFGDLCDSINTDAGGPGAFHVSIGDIDGRVWENRDVIDDYFGASAIWYPIIGNHEEEDGIEMEWLRNEYDNGNDVRTPLKEYTNQDGPTGTVRLNYTWDYGNAHFVAMNQYWNGGTNEGSGTSISGSDTAADGDVVPALRAWLEADLAANTKPFVFVFGHEPAFPKYRHIGDSLDAHPANRDAFWQVLEDNDVVAFMNGHTHVYYRHQGDKNGIGDTWQIDGGNAGNESSEAPDGFTYVDVRVSDFSVTFDVWRDPDKNGTYVLQDSWTELAPSRSLAWDEIGPGNWHEEHWVGDVPPNLPDVLTHVEVKTNTVTVADNASALSLTITSGGVDVNPAVTLDVGQGVDVVAGSLGVAGTLNAQSLTTAGTSTVAEGGIVTVTEGAEVTAGSFGVAGTLHAQSLAATGTGGVAASGNVSIDEHVEVAADASLGVSGTLEAQSLTTAGMTTVGDGATVTVAQGVEVAAGATLDLAGGLSAQSLSTAGTNLVTAGANLSVAGALSLDSSLDLTGATLVTTPLATTVEVNEEGALTLDQSLAAGEVTIAGEVHSAGATLSALNLTDGGLLSSSANVIAEEVNVSNGTVCLTDGAELVVGKMHAVGGTIDTGTGSVVVDQSLKVGGNTTFAIADGTFTVEGSNVADTAVPGLITLGGGTLTIGGAGIVPSGAIGTWKFEEGSGPTTADSSTVGNDHVGTLVGASWETGDPEHPTALRFEGSTADPDYVDIGNNGDIQVDAPHTLALWIKTEQAGGDLISRGSGNNRLAIGEKALCIGEDFGDYGAIVYDGRLGQLTGSIDVTDGQWHHVAVTYNVGTSPGDQEVYVDGVNYTYDRGCPDEEESGSKFRFGWPESRQAYYGLMDDVYVYDRSLSPAEISELREALGDSVEELPNTSLHVTADTALHLAIPVENFVLGNLTLEPDVTLSISGTPVGFQDVAAGHLSSIEGSLSIGGTICPGDSPGTLEVIGDLEMGAGSVYEWELGASAADLIDVSGELGLSAEGWSLKLIDDGAVSPGGDLVLFTYGSLAGGSLGNWGVDCSEVPHWVFDGGEPVLTDDSLHQCVLLTGLIAVPEPGTLAMTALALIGLLAYSVRRWPYRPSH